MRGWLDLQDDCIQFIYFFFIVHMSVQSTRPCITLGVYSLADIKAMDVKPCCTMLLLGPRSLRCSICNGLPDQP